MRCLRVGPSDCTTPFVPASPVGAILLMAERRMQEKMVRAAGKWKNDPKTSNHKAKTLNPKTVENGGGAFKGRREIRKRGKPEDKKP